MLLGLGRQRRGEHDEVGLGEQLGERLRAADAGRASGRRATARRRPSAASESAAGRRIGATRPPGSRTPSRARRPPARSIPSPTMPTVTSRSSAPSSGCHVRSRCSSRSCGSRRLTARIIISTYSAIGPAEHAAGVRDDDAALAGRRASAPARRPPSRSGPSARCGARARRRSNASRAQPAAEHHLDVVERTVGEALDGHRDEPGARAPRRGSRSRSRDR